MARQPFDRFPRQLGAEFPFKQPAMFHVKHL